MQTPARRNASAQSHALAQATGLAFAGETAVAIDLRSLAFRRLDAAGNTLPEGVVEGHVATHYPQVGLIFDIRKPKTVRSLKAAQKVAADCDLLGRKGEWVIGEDVEVAALIDRRFHEPAVNPKAAPNMPDRGWIYTATKTAWSSDHVWFVYLSGGNVLWSYDGFEGLAVPVLRVPPSQ